MSAEPIKDVTATEPFVAEPATATTTTAAPVATEPVVDAPATTDATATTTEAPVASTEAVKEEDATKTENKIPAEPVTEGTLGYKAPGLIKSLRFSKKYFWLGEEAIEDAALATYLRGEKSDAGHANAAHASQTGKGLFLFAKRVEDRSSPSGILNLGEATEIVKEEPSEFSFKLHGQKHTFQASTKAERDGWLISLEKAAGEAKTSHESITSSEGYKSKLSKFTKPAGALVTPASTTKTPVKTEDKVHDGTTPAAVTADASSEPVKPTEKAEKSRSQSRKRQSLFGGFLNKAEEKKDIKKEERAEKKAEKEVEKEEKKEEVAPTKIDQDVTADSTAAPVEPVVAPAIGETSTTEQVKPVEETPAAAATTTTTAEPAQSPNPLKSKRGSVFGSFFKPTPKKEEKKEDVVPAVPAKDTEPVATEAPQIGPVDTAVPAETTAAPVASEPVVAETTTAPAATKETPAASSPPKSGGFLSFFKQKEAQHEAKKEEKKEEKAEEKVEKKEEEAAVKEAKKSEETPVPAPAPAVVTPSTEPKDKRRSSFFGTLASKKEKKSETTSDAENTDGEKKGTNIKGLFRKASRGAKPTTGPVTDSSAPPAVPAKDAEPVLDADPAAETTETSALPTATSAETATVAPIESEIPAAEKPIVSTPAVTASA